MATVRKAVLMLAIFLIASAPLALAQGTYTQIDVPGAVATNANGIDVAGHVTGIYVDSDNRAHGFLLNAGVYATIDYPAASFTYLFNINNRGQVVGWADSGTGFVYSIPTHEFTEIAYPGAPDTFPTAINDAGVIGGAYALNGDRLGFALTGSTYRHIGVNGSLYSWVMGVSGSSEFVGPMNDTNFIFSQGKYQVLNFKDLTSAVVTGIRPDDKAIVGYYYPAIGFLYQEGTVTTLQFPESSGTYPSSINDSGKVVGFFFDAEGNQHGFTWTPPADDRNHK
jgi:probable HAF family extracellular repeat protein